MKLYNELSEAIEETIDTMNESPEFEMQFRQLIRNYFDDSCADSDINDAIERVRFVEGVEHEN